MNDLSFERASYSLKSDSVNIEQKGVVIKLKNLPPLFVPNDKEVDFYNDKFGQEEPDFEKLSNIIDNSNNLISLWDQIDSGYDYWSKELLDTSSKIVIRIEQAEGYYQNPLVARVEDTMDVLVGVIQSAWEQDIVLNKIIYDCGDIFGILEFATPYRLR